jgi:hypothetical protein
MSSAVDCPNPMSETTRFQHFVVEDSLMHRRLRGVIVALFLSTGTLIGCSSSLTTHQGTGGRGGSQQGGSGGTLILGSGGFHGGSGGSDGADAGCQAGAECPMGACVVAGSCICGVPLVCFGSDPTVYEKYLNPRDGGYSAGYCPTTDDFHHACGEGSLCYYGCGPLSPADIAAAQDAGVGPATDGGPDACCFWVFGIAGV